MAFREHRRKTMAEVDKVLVAVCNDNALAVIEDCKEDGVATVAVFAADDAQEPCVIAADERVCIGQSRDAGVYEDHYAILAAAELKHANAIHLCGGPLSGDADFAQTATAAGFLVVDTMKEGE